jgi:hypothetical protein
MLPDAVCSILHTADVAVRNNLATVGAVSTAHIQLQTL